MMETISQPMVELEHVITANTCKIWKHIRPISARMELLAF